MAIFRKVINALQTAHETSRLAGILKRHRLSTRVRDFDSPTGTAAGGEMFCPHLQ